MAGSAAVLSVWAAVVIASRPTPNAMINVEMSLCFMGRQQFSSFGFDPLRNDGTGRRSVSRHQLRARAEYCSRQFPDCRVFSPQASPVEYFCDEGVQQIRARGCHHP